MKFSNETMAILKNFASINPSIVLDKGNVIKTISPEENVFAKATIDEEIEGEAGIYDLSRFLSTLSLFDDPEINFGVDEFIIEDGNKKINYRYASKNVLIYPTFNEVDLEDYELEFILRREQLESAIKAASVLSLEGISVVSTEDKIYLKAIDKTGSINDTFSLEVCDNDSGEEIDLTLNRNYLRMIPSDYKVRASEDGAFYFFNNKLEYLVATEAETE